MTDDTDVEEIMLPWAEGIPTAPDVEALMKAFPTELLIPGWTVLDAEVKKHIGRCDGNRFRTVTAAWRRRLLNTYGLNMYRKDTEGFYVPTTQEVLAQAHPRIKHAGRTFKKHIRELAVTKATNDGERTETEHQGRLMHSLSRESKKARMGLLPSTAQSAQPKIGPPAAKQK